MFRSRKIILKYTPLALAIEILCFALIMAVMYIVVTFYPETPDMIPSRFDAGGEVSEWAVRETALLPPILAVFLYVTVTGAGIIIRRAVPENNRVGLLPPILTALLAAKAVYLLFAIIRTYSAVRAAPVPATALFIMPVGFVITLCCCCVSVSCRYKRRKKGR